MNYRRLGTWTIITGVCCFCAVTLSVVGWSASPALSIRTTDLPMHTKGTAYSFLASVDQPSRLGQNVVSVEILRGGQVVLRKTLTAGDGDFYTILSGEPAQLRTSSPVGVQVKTSTTPVPAGQYVENEPNDDWAHATPIVLAATVWASGDEAEYLPGPAKHRVAEDWFQFEFRETTPKLVHLLVDFTDRDNIPVNISLHRRVQDKLVEYTEGEDPVGLPHEVQALPGNKFTTRVLREPGTYYVRVEMTHPLYKLQTRVYDLPPYSDPSKAVQTAIDYMIAAGDSWHANTPRRGGVFDRVASVHQETSLCVACHPTHFTLRAQLYAARNGYAIHYPGQLQFLAERFYNNPRPLYGFEQEGASWARVISAPANVLGRMSHLIDLYEKQTGVERRPEFHRGVAEYLKLYYGGRTKLPPDETNGNTPLVSTYEVAWYAWEDTHDPKIAALIEQDAIKNVIDLCYQTLALAAIDKQKYSATIARNAERILSLQRPDGEWSARLEPESKSVEFQTGHALWALNAAGIPRSEPHVKKGLDYLLSRQQSFGGWMDPLQSYENFRTPFRETQMAVLALSAYYPRESEKLNGEKARLTLDAQDPLTRALAIEQLGRDASPGSLAGLAGALGDDSKIVQRVAAWAMRQVYSRHPDANLQPLTAALSSPSERVRWGATRVFASHFAALARRPELVPPLSALLDDVSVTVRMQAVKGLWQYWFWSPNTASKEQIEDALLSAMSKPQPAWMERNLEDAVYNLADENVRYLYNNWVPAIARPEDRERVIRGRLAVEARLAEKFARALETGSEQQKKRLLTGLSELELRRGDVYDPTADHSTKFEPVYNRIGNDIEQTVFFGASNDRFARALRPLAESSDPEMKRLALNSSLVLREMNFAEVARIAGPPKGDRDPILAMRPHDPKPKAGSMAAKASSTGSRPDDDYFRGYVEPILTTRGKDGYACVHCHATHTLFNGTLESAKRIINVESPEESLILRKPISDAESEGTLDSSKVPHGGGHRFDKGSAEYNTILNWIRGTKP
jgi:HEAT repeat protein